MATKEKKPVKKVAPRGAVLRALEEKLTAAVRHSIDAVAERRALEPGDDFCLRPMNPV